MASRDRVIRVTISGDASSLSRAFGQASVSSQGLQAGFKKLMGLAGIGGLALAMVKLVTSVAKLSGEFETTMARIVGLVGIGKSVVEGWSQSILKLAPAVGKSPIELAKAMYFISSAGLRGQVALEALEFSAKGAAAGLGLTKDVAFAVVSAVNAYGSANMDAAMATDVLVNAVRLGNVEATDLAGVIGNVIPVSSELGVEFHEVGGALAAMTRLGLDASTATTSLRQILVTLLKPTVGAQRKMKELDLSAEGLRDTLRNDGLLVVLQLLREKMRDNEAGIVKIFPNIRALAGVLNLVGQNADTTAWIMDEMADSAGTLDEAFNAISDTAQFRLSQSMAELQVAGTEIGDNVLPTLVDITKTMTPALISAGQALGEIFVGLQPLIELFGQLLSFLAPLAGQFGPVILAIWALNKAVLATGASLIAMKAKMVAAVAATGLSGLAGSMAALKAAINPVTVAIGVAVVALFAWNSARQKHEASIESLIGTLNKETTAITDNTRAYVIDELHKNGTLDLLRKYGIASSRYVSAVLGEEAAVEEMNVKLGSLLDSRQTELKAISDQATAQHSATGISIESQQALTSERDEIQRLQLVQEDWTDRVEESIEVTKLKNEAMREGSKYSETATKEARELHDATRREIEAFEDLDPEMESVIGEMHDAKDATEGLTDETWNLVDGLNEAFEKQTSLSNALKRSADPVFDAISAVGDYQDALADLDEVKADVESSTQDIAEAELEVLEASLVAQGAMDNLSGQPYEDAMMAMQLATGKTREELEELLTQVGILENKHPVMILEVRAPVVRYMQNEAGWLIPGQNGFMQMARGGIVTGPTAALIGEAGSNEAVVPLNDQGMAFMAEAMSRALNGGGAGGAGVGAGGRIYNISINIDGLIDLTNPTASARQFARELRQALIDLEEE